MAVMFDISRHFTPEQMSRLAEIADRLVPHAEDIVNAWVDKQRSFEEVPTVSREKLLSLFTTLFYGTLDALRSGNISQYLSIQLPIVGKSLVETGFPYEHLVIAVHFLEESYLPFLTEFRPGRAIDISIYAIVDKFWHFWIAELVYSYFYEVRRSLTEEVEIGRSIQSALRPDIPERIGNLQMGTFYASATAGAQIGGDVYDIVDFDGAIQHIIIGDFSGKGLRAATKTANVRAMFRGFAIEYDSPAAIANRLNRILYNELAPNEFETAFLARIDQRDGSFRFVNAGHPGPILVREGGTAVLPEGENPALGILLETEFSEGSIELTSGSMLIFYTDGIVEARKDSTFFGIDGILQSARRNMDASPSEMASAIWNDCLSFANGKVEDDVAIVIMRRTQP